MATTDSYYRKYYCTDGKLVDNYIDNYIYKNETDATGGYSEKYKLPTNKYKKLCENLEKDIKELKKKKDDGKKIELGKIIYLRIKEKENKNLKTENEGLKNIIIELEERIEKLNKYNRFNIMEI